jgi:outer membrane protein assembly factor BamB
LLVSLATAIRLAREDYPAVAQALTEKCEAIGKLRVASAASEADRPALELATAQFAGSSAAKAHQWLADEALMRGQFSRALFHYGQSEHSDASLKSEIAPRIRLAAAMLGRDEYSLPNETVEFGKNSLSKAEFQRLVLDMWLRAAEHPLAPRPSAAGRVPAPARYKAIVRGAFDGPAGEQPQDDLGRRTIKLGVPWVDRQLATAMDDDTLYISNRFQVSSFDLNSGERRWQSEQPPGAMQRSQEWGLIPMRPLVVGERIFVRLLYSSSPQLVCLEKRSGKIVWTGETREQEFLVGDPLMVDGRLISLAVAIGPDQQGTLRLQEFEPRSGEIVRFRDLVRLRSSWGSRACCQAVFDDDRLIVALGGVVVSTDIEGDVDWIRKQNVTSAESDPRWVVQTFQPPVVADGRAFIAQPGVKSVDCLDAVTGRMLWSASPPGLVGLVGLAGECVVVRTETSLCGLDLRDGSSRWTASAHDVFSNQLLDKDYVLFASRETVGGKKNESQVKLTWLSVKDGAAVSSCVVAKLGETDPQLGPLIARGERLFGLFGRGARERTRDLVEFSSE